MDLSVNLCRCAALLISITTIWSTNVAGERYLQSNNRTCTPAEAEPTLQGSLCHPLVNLNQPFCQNHGIILSNYVYTTPDDQVRNNDEMNSDYRDVMGIGVAEISSYFKVNNATVKKCIKALSILFCHYHFPSCDRTQSVYRRQYMCRETCFESMRICGNIWKRLERFFIFRYPKMAKLVSCELQPYRNAGDSPECWYYNEFSNSTDSSKASELDIDEDCLYLKGSSYRGNMSLTKSGTPCQSWTEQCPHRHTMNTTYPELNDAKNHCRNPKNSGQRPWCFTTDPNKRWEYCDIPKCSPVDGKYGDWSLNSTCNVTCGKGFEIWTRKCNNPDPRLGGRNCSHLGRASEERPCLAKPCPVNGKYGKWSLNSTCNVTCGKGFEIWTRKCNDPEPKYGGKNCSHLGNATEKRRCIGKACPVNGGYSNWTLSAHCNVSCGEGVEIWERTCDNPKPKYGGRNCSKLGNPKEFKNCTRRSCPTKASTNTSIDSGNWKRLSPCSVTCGEGVEVWKRVCVNHRGINDRNCSNWGANEEFRSCKIKPCSGPEEEKPGKVFDSRVIGATVAVSAFVVIVAVVFFVIFCRRKRRNSRGSSYYAMPDFSSQQ